MTADEYWKFEGVLNSAIENVVRRYRGPLGRGLNHRGVDFSGAVARQLYTDALNDTALRGAFLKSCKSECMLAVVRPDLVDLAREVSRLAGQKCLFILPWPSRAYLIKSLFKFPKLVFLLKRMLKAKSNELPIAISEVGSGSVFCFAHHPKFVGHLKSVASTVAVPYFFPVRDKLEMASLGLLQKEVIRIPEATTDGLSRLEAYWPDIASYSRRIELLITECSPSLLIYCEGDAWYQDLVARIGQKYGVPSVCMQWGAFPYETPRTGLRNMGCDYFFAWGEYFVEQLRPFNRHLKMVSVGNQALHKQANVGLSKKVVILLNTDPQGRATGLDAYHIPFFSIIGWLAINAPEWSIVVRTHPTIPLIASDAAFLSQYSNIELHDSRTKPLVESVSGADLALTVSSSAVVEAAISGAVPFIFNPSPWYYQPDFSSVFAGFEVKSVTAAIEVLGRILRNPELLVEYKLALDTFCPRLFLETGKNARYRVGQAIRGILDSSASVAMD
jgi:hypothetical protein